MVNHLTILIDHHDCHISPSYCLIEARCLDIAHAWEEDRTATVKGEQILKGDVFLCFLLTGYILTQPMDPEKKSLNGLFSLLNM